MRGDKVHIAETAAVFGGKIWKGGTARTLAKMIGLSRV
jgi:hypothetical protein